MTFKRIICSLLFFQNLLPITLVYNLKLRRAFSIGTESLRHEKPTWIATAVPIVFKRKRHIIDPTLNVDVCDKNTIGGSLLNLRYKRDKYWWFEVGTGIEKERTRVWGTSNYQASRSGVDDIVVAAGRNFFYKDRIQFVPYIIAGFPVEKNVTLQEKFDTLVGARFYALGAGIELSYAFVNTLQRSFIGFFQQRYLHFFARRWYPILPCTSKIQPGNAIDLLFSLQYRCKRTITEAGYNPTFFFDQGIRAKTGTTIVPWFLRYGVYASVAYVPKKFPIFKQQTIIGAGLNITRSDRHDNNTLITWGVLTVIF